MAGGKYVFVLADGKDRDRLENDGFVHFIDKYKYDCDYSYDELLGETEPSAFDKSIEECDKKEGKKVVVVSENLKDDWLTHCVNTLTDFICFIINPQKDPPPNLCVMAQVRYDGVDWEKKLKMCLDSPGSCDAIFGRVAPGLFCSHIDYLDAVLPAVPNALNEWKKSNECGDGRVIAKMINLIPHSCDIPRLTENLAKNFKLMKDKVKIRITYHDTPGRVFDMNIYRIENPSDNKEFYYAILMPNSSLSTLYDMKEDPLSGFNDVMIEREREMYAEQLKCMVDSDNIAVLPLHDTKQGFDLTSTILKKCKKLEKI